MNYTSSASLFTSAAFQQYFRTSPQSLILKADPPVFTIVAASDQYLRDTHQLRADVLNRGLFDVYPGNPAEAAQQAGVLASFKRVIAGKARDILPVFHYEISIGDSGKKETLYWSVTNEPVLDESGNVAYLINTTRNVTDEIHGLQAYQDNARLKNSPDEEPVSGKALEARDEAMQKLNTQLVSDNEKLQNFLDTISEGIGVTDTEGNIIWTNAGARRILKIDAASVLLRKNSSPEWSNCFLDGSAMLHQDHPITVALKTGNPVRDFDMMLRSPGDQPLYLRMNALPLRDNSGGITGAIGSFSDVTADYRSRQEIQQLHHDLKSAYLELQGREQSLRATVDAAKLGTYSMNADNRQVSLNTYGQQLFNVGRPDLPLSDFLAMLGERGPGIGAAMIHALQHDESFVDEVTVTRLDGSIRWMTITGTAITERGDSEAQLHGLLADITNQKDAEQRKNDFFGIVSHELRTPLTSISGYTQLIQQRSLLNKDAFLADLAGRVDRQVQRMNGLITGFLDLTRASEGKIKLDPTLFDLGELLRLVYRDTLSRFSDHSFRLAESCPVFIEGDAEKIEQVLTNLLHNAVKYSPAGSLVELRCEQTDTRVRIEVSDQGMGISGADQEKLFDRFFRVESVQTKSITGFGIGLYLSKLIIELHGGTIGVESQPGAGSTFWFELPLG